MAYKTLLSQRKIFIAMSFFCVVLFAAIFFHSQKCSGPSKIRALNSWKRKNVKKEFEIWWNNRVFPQQMMIFFSSVYFSYMLIFIFLRCFSAEAYFHWKNKRTNYGKNEKRKNSIARHNIRSLIWMTKYCLRDLSHKQWQTSNKSNISWVRHRVNQMERVEIQTMCVRSHVWQWLILSIMTFGRLIDYKETNIYLSFAFHFDSHISITIQKTTTTTKKQKKERKSYNTI